MKFKLSLVIDPCAFIIKDAYLFISLVIAISFLNNASAALKTFTSNDGNSLRAEIIKVETNNVTLKREDGRVFTVNLDRFSPESQSEIKNASETVEAKTPDVKPEVIQAKTSEVQQPEPKRFHIKNESKLDMGSNIMIPFASVSNYHGLKMDKKDIVKLTGKTQTFGETTKILENFGLEMEDLKPTSQEEAIKEIKRLLINSGPVIVNITGEPIVIAIGYNDATETIETLGSKGPYNLKYKAFRDVYSLTGFKLIKDEISPETTEKTVKAVLEFTTKATTFAEIKNTIFSNTKFKKDEGEANSDENSLSPVSTKQQALKNGYEILRNNLKRNAVIIIPQNKDCDALMLYLDPKTGNTTSQKLVKGKWEKSEASISNAIETWTTKIGDSYKLPILRINYSPK